jgi:ABC-type Fe2+-enterobactin transport system substrate-binding protein
MMMRLATLLTTATINAIAVPAVASQCTPPNAIAATRTHWAAIRSQFSKVADREAACRAYATSFYESVTVRQAAAGCTGYADITALDSEINTFNELLATKCGD